MDTTLEMNKVEEIKFTKSEAKRLLDESLQTHSWVPLHKILVALVDTMPEDREDNKEEYDTISVVAAGPADGMNKEFTLPHKPESEDHIKVVGGPVNNSYRIKDNKIIFDKPPHPQEHPVVKIIKPKVVEEETSTTSTTTKGLTTKEESTRIKENQAFLDSLKLLPPKEPPKEK